MSFYTNLKSDFYKFFHSPLWIIHLAIPMIGIALFLCYYRFSSWTETTKVSNYIQVLGVCFPTLISIITSILAETEQKAGNFQMILATANSKNITHMTKMFWLIFFGFGSAVLAAVGFGVGFNVLGYTTYGVLFFFEVAVLLTISVLPLYLLHYIVSFILGKGPSLGLGIVGSLLSALLLTRLGDYIWTFIPWGIVARFSTTLLLSHIKNVVFLQYHGIIKSIIYVLFYTILFFIAQILIFNKWEGRKSED